MVKKKVKSKRQSLGLKYRIKNKVKEHRRKQNRLAKKNPPSKKSKKDPGIPNSWPFKEELLNQIEQERQAVAEEKQKQKAARQAAKRKQKKKEQLEQRRQQKQQEADEEEDGEDNNNDDDDEEEEDVDEDVEEATSD